MNYTTQTYLFSIKAIFSTFSVHIS